MGFLADAYGEPDGPGAPARPDKLTPDERISLRASTQHGVISTAQLLDCGLNSQAIYRRVKSDA